jgi:integrase
MKSLTRADARHFADTISRLPANWKKNPQFKNLRAAKVIEKAEKLGMLACNPNTAKGYIVRFSSFIGFCAKEDIIEKNIAMGLTGRRSNDWTEKSRLPFSIPELQKIFCKDYKNLARPHSTVKRNLPKNTLPTDARYWAPLIALYTGMRLSEICQLTRQEVVQIDKVWCIKITGFVEPDSEEDAKILRSRKSRAAERFIPVSDQLIKFGFLKFVDNVCNSPTQRLFPDLKPDKQGYLGNSVSRWFARHLDEVGITSGKKVFHSFRHTFRDALRHAKVNRDVVLSVGGWSSSETADGYGEGVTVAFVKEELSRVTYSGLDLSHFEIND